MLANNSLVIGSLTRRLAPWCALLILSTAQAQGVIQVPSVSVQFKSVGIGFELDGLIQPVKQSTISAQAAGRVATLLVKAGDKVQAGQLLLSIDDREAQTGVQRSQAQVAQAQAELRNAQANFDRTRNLQAKGFVSSAALDTADSQLKSALAGRDQARRARVAVSPRDRFRPRAASADPSAPSTPPATTPAPRLRPPLARSAARPPRAPLGTPPMAAGNLARAATAGSHVGVVTVVSSVTVEASATSAQVTSCAWI